MTLLERLEACVEQYWWRPRRVDVVDRPELCYLHSTLIPALNIVLRVNGLCADAPTGPLDRRGLRRAHGDGALVVGGSTGPSQAEVVADSA